mgnify:CR=1 FL=1
MKKRNIIHSALSLSLTAALCLSMAACGGTQPPADSSAASAAPAQPAAVQPAAEEPTSTALPVKALHPKQVDENPYMAKSDANIHHDGYNTDSTDEILPLGIYPEINVSYEKTNANASPAIYFDSYGHAVVPLLGGIAIRDLNAEETKTLGYFSPKKHDGGGYVIQSSYTFLDSENRIVCPTSNNHVLMLRATDESGNVLPEFEKVLDIDIKAAAEAALGKELTQNLLSVVFDYDGNLWFATGGFRIYPQRQQQGVIGYIAHSAIDAILNGKQTDLSKAVFVHELTPGEGAENGIAASKEGAVILTNQNCYLLRAEDGVNVVWCTPYKSVGAKVSGEGDKTTGGGLAWGGGCSPTLTPNLVLFTDNQDPVNLLALDMKTGEVVASTPVLDDLPEGYQVAVENSAIVYDDGEGTVSTIVCNWFGAGNAGLADPNNDSSIQSYANIYDQNWLMKGNAMIAPGVVGMLIWQNIFEPTSGLFSKLMESIGLIGKGEVIDFLNDSKWVIPSVIILGFPWVNGTNILIYISGMNAVSGEVIEASELDGCGTWRRIFSIDIPLLVGQIRYFFIFGLIGLLQDYSIQIVLTNGGPGYDTYVPGWYMYKLAFTSGRYGYACAIGTVLFIAILSISLVAFKLMHYGPFAKAQEE